MITPERLVELHRLSERVRAGIAAPQDLAFLADFSLDYIMSQPTEMRHFVFQKLMIDGRLHALLALCLKQQQQIIDLSARVATLEEFCNYKAGEPS